MAKCKYKSQFREDYKCPEDALSDSKDGYCVFHERRIDKDIDKFNAGIKAKMENKDYEFTGYYFPENINFFEYNRGKFERQASFMEAEFQGEALFNRAEFKDAASFDRAKFQGEAWFGKAEFHARASFDGAKFQGKAWFDGAEFKGEAWFIGAEFQREASFYDADFQGRALFYGAKFQREASFYGAEFGRTVSFRYADFKHPEDAEVAYRKAKISYQREGDYAEAGYYHLKEMRARRKAKKRLESAIFRKSFTFLRNNGPQILLKILQPISILAEHFPALKRSNFVRKIEIFRKKLIKPSPGFWEKLENRLVIAGRGLERFFMDWTCGYGEKPLWVIRTAAIVILGIAILYWLSGGIVLRPGAGITIREPGFLDSVYFSVVTFTTLGYGDWHPDPNHWIRYFAMAEAFTGAFMMALFVLCFARKWMR